MDLLSNSPLPTIIMIIIVLIIINIFRSFNLTNEYLSAQSLISCCHSVKEQKTSKSIMRCPKGGSIMFLTDEFLMILP